MAKAFVKPVTTVGAAAERLSTLMIAEGYTGSFLGNFLQITAPNAASVYWGSDDSVDATGNEIPTGASQFLPSNKGIIDPALYWIFTAATQEVQIAFQSL